MIKIRRHKKRSVPSLNMASMPDLIFTVLFFFMIVTHMRNETVKVQLEVPQGTEVTKQSHRSSTINIYIGKTPDGEIHIQAADKLCDITQATAIVLEHKKALDEEEQESMTVNLRADRTVPMGIINELKYNLRKAGVLSIRYSATEEKAK